VIDLVHRLGPTKQREKEKTEKRLKVLRGKERKKERRLAYLHRMISKRQAQGTRNREHTAIMIITKR